MHSTYLQYCHIEQYSTVQRFKASVEKCCKLKLKVFIFISKQQLPAV